MIGFITSFFSTEDTIRCNTGVDQSSDFNIEPFVDYGASFSAIGEVELMLLQTSNPPEDFKLEAKPVELEQYKYWQYGAGAHSIEKRQIQGYCML